MGADGINQPDPELVGEGDSDGGGDVRYGSVANGLNVGERRRGVKGSTR